MLPLLCTCLFFISTGLSAQTKTNVYWTTDSDVSGKNTIYYDAAQLLTWADFKGMFPPDGPVAALTTSGFGYKADMHSSGGKSQINIGIYCFFSKDKSWVKPGRNTIYILNHEQHHFDVSFLAANLFIDKVRAANLTFSNCNAELPKLYKECCDIMNQMQNDYDSQTHNGIVDAQQQKWNNYINGKLAQLKHSR